MWTNGLLIVCGALLLSTHSAEARASGAPSAVCADGNQLPQHGPVAQTSVSPYTLTASATEYVAGDTVTGKCVELRYLNRHESIERTYK